MGFPGPEIFDVHIILTAVRARAVVFLAGLLVPAAFAQTAAPVAEQAFPDAPGYAHSIY
jgi:hypothetical protein